MGDGIDEGLEGGHGFDPLGGLSGGVRDGEADTISTPIAPLKIAGNLSFGSRTLFTLFFKKTIFEFSNGSLHHRQMFNTAVGKE